VSFVEKAVLGKKKGGLHMQERRIEIGFDVKIASRLSTEPFLGFPHVYIGTIPGVQP